MKRKKKKKKRFYFNLALVYKCFPRHFLGSCRVSLYGDLLLKPPQTFVRHCTVLPTSPAFSITQYRVPNKNCRNNMV